MKTTTVLILIAVMFLLLKFGGIVYLYRAWFPKASKGTPIVFNQSRGRYCYGRQETERRKRQIDRGYLTRANGLYFAKARSGQANTDK